MRQNNSRAYFIIIVGLLALSSIEAFAALPSGFEVYFNDGQHSSTNGIETKFIDYLASAQTSVSAAFYSIDLMVIANAFGDAVSRLGADNVRLIVESSNSDSTACKAMANFGVRIIDETCDGWASGAFESHNKFCVIDEEKVWTGSLNMTYKNTKQDTNNVIVIDCPVLAQAYLAEFNEMWGATSGPAGNCHFSTHKTTVIDHTYDCNGVQVDLYFSPTAEAAPNRALEAIEALFSGSQSSLYFDIYTFTSDMIADPIIDVFRNGKTVQGIMDDLQADSIYSNYNVLKNQGIDVKLDSEVDPHGDALHHKFAVIDRGTSNAAVLTGSYNWTNAAQNSNDENSIIVHNAEIAEEYYKEFYRNYYGADPDPGELSISVAANQTSYQGGNYFRIWTSISNPVEDRTLDEYVILDLGEAFGANRFYFWPDWTSAADSQHMFLSADDEFEQEILALVLPSPLGAAGPFTIWAALVDPESGELACDYDFVQFSFE
jgi:hypothetical protein